MSKHKSVLMVITSSDRIDDTRTTGIWFEGFSFPYMQFTSIGFDVTIASPQGKEASVAPQSTLKPEEASRWTEASKALQHSKTLNSVNAGDFDVLFLVCEYSTMFDLLENVVLKELLTSFVEVGKVIAAVCDGVAGLVSAGFADSTPLLVGKTANNQEECTVRLDMLLTLLSKTELHQLSYQLIIQPEEANQTKQDSQPIKDHNYQLVRNVTWAVIKALQPLPLALKPLTVPGSLESLARIKEYVRTAAIAAGLDNQPSYKLVLAVDEIATNIISYGYANCFGNLNLQAEIDEYTLTISMEDTGIPYDPTQQPLPDLTLPLNERDPGGVGVYLAINGVNRFIYERVESQNRNTFVVNRIK